MPRLAIGWHGRVVQSSAVSRRAVDVGTGATLGEGSDQGKAGFFLFDGTADKQRLTSNYLQKTWFVNMHTLRVIQTVTIIY